MANTTTSFLPRRSIILIVICSLGILGFFLFAIYPNQKAAAALDAGIAQVRLQIEEQKILRPIYEQLREIQKASKEREKINLPLSRVGKPSKAEDINQLRSLIFNIVRENRLAAEIIEPDVATILDNSGRIKMDIAVTGYYDNFRGFMIQLNGRLPSVESIESLRIVRVPMSTDHRLSLAIWLTQA